MEDILLAFVGQVHNIHPIEWAVIVTNIGAVAYKTWLSWSERKERKRNQTAFLQAIDKKINVVQSPPKVSVVGQIDQTTITSEKK